MAQLTTQARSAKRSLAEAGLRLALDRIEAARDSGGPETYGTYYYERALALVRHVETLLRQSEGK